MSAEHISRRPESRGSYRGDDLASPAPLPRGRQAHTSAGGEVSRVRILIARASVAGALVCAVIGSACGGGNTPPAEGQATPGAERTTKTAALETGADVIQAKAPVEQISMYLNGFHVAKHDAALQMEAHHYCNQLNEELAQCVLFDGNTDTARMSGVEYIISERLYTTLPENERAYWHPHNYEILSGTLRMPGLPDAVEGAALETKINSYGKTWHTWMTGVHGHEGDQLPFGPAVLQWSFNHDGEAKAAMVDARDGRMGLNTAETRERRQALVQKARPQGGVDAMGGAFATAQGIPGVVDNGDASTRPVPRLETQPAARRSPRR